METFNNWPLTLIERISNRFEIMEVHPQWQQQLSVGDEVIAVNSIDMSIIVGSAQFLLDLFIVDPQSKKNITVRKTNGQEIVVSVERMSRELTIDAMV